MSRGGGSGRPARSSGPACERAPFNCVAAGGVGVERAGLPAESGLNERRGRPDLSGERAVRSPGLLGRCLPGRTGGAFVQAYRADVPFVPPVPGFRPAPRLRVGFRRCGLMISVWGRAAVSWAVGRPELVIMRSRAGGRRTAGPFVRTCCERAPRSTPESVPGGSRSVFGSGPGLARGPLVRVYRVNAPFVHLGGSARALPGRTSGPFVQTYRTDVPLVPAWVGSSAPRRLMIRVWGRAAVLSAVGRPEVVIMGSWGGKWAAGPFVRSLRPNVPLVQRRAEPPAGNPPGIGAPLRRDGAAFVGFRHGTQCHVALPSPCEKLRCRTLRNGAQLVAL